VIAGPLGAQEGILYAECNLQLGITMKLRHDFAGHYNRPDIFHLQINRAAPRLYSVHGRAGDLPASSESQPVSAADAPGMLSYHSPAADEIVSSSPKTERPA
jgi:hypothetical protein